ncbi:MAG: hypothetical protein K0R63_1791 [Rickettsiales bacterium]|jgi:hypothetical protein|nr:hypothetical protein [Rickettsiales bacterium]
MVPAASQALPSKPIEQEQKPSKPTVVIQRRSDINLKSPQTERTLMSSYEEVSFIAHPHQKTEASFAQHPPQDEQKKKLATIRARFEEGPKATGGSWHR